MQLQLDTMSETEILLTYKHNAHLLMRALSNYLVTIEQ